MWNWNWLGFMPFIFIFGQCNQPLIAPDLRIYVCTYNENWMKGANKIVHFSETIMAASATTCTTLALEKALKAD
jgi:hypothetical protein